MHRKKIFQLNGFQFEEERKTQEGAHAAESIFFHDPGRGAISFARAADFSKGSECSP